MLHHFTNYYCHHTVTISRIHRANGIVKFLWIYDKTQSIAADVNRKLKATTIGSRTGSDFRFNKKRNS